jgi:hypothetical protein
VDFQSGVWRFVSDALYSAPPVISGTGDTSPLRGSDKSLSLMSSWGSPRPNASQLFVRVCAVAAAYLPVTVEVAHTNCSGRI